MSSRPFHHILPSSLDVVHDQSPLRFFAPTSTKLVRHRPHHAHINWNAREHRKQRYRIDSPRSGRRRFSKGAWIRVAKMCRLEYWNISWWVAVLFTIGSIVWVINGFQVFLPFATSVPASPGASGWTGWVGATIFAVGSVLLIPEAWNRDDVVGFGSAIEHALHDDEAKDVSPGARTRWVWWSNDRKYWHELGFVAGFAQLCGATIFWISGFTGISKILGVLERHTGALDAVFWVPQVVGGTGFIISSTLYMLEAQKRWYMPAVVCLGWHVGFWNFVGAIGFTLSGAFGLSRSMYQSSLATFWGSWAFLIGSVLQWYEAVNPVSASATGLGERL